MALPRRYEFVGCLGEGTYGTVWKCKDTETGQMVAMKRFKTTDMLEQLRQINEVRLLRTCNHHPNVVQLSHVFKSKGGRVYMVMELVEHTLVEVLGMRPGGLSLSRLKVTLWQLLQATAFLHCRNIIHRDLKPSNILLKPDGTVKLCDFGFARTISKASAGDYSPYVVTRWYRPPELLVGGPYGAPVDMWTLGCLFGEMAAGQPLFPGRDTLDQLRLIMQAVGPLPAWQVRRMCCDDLLRGVEICPPKRVLFRDRFPNFTPEMMEVLTGCLHPDPAKRLTASQVLALPFFDDMHEHIGGTPLHKTYSEAYKHALLSGCPGALCILESSRTRSKGAKNAAGGCMQKGLPAGSAAADVAASSRAVARATSQAERAAAASQAWESHAAACLSCPVAALASHHAANAAAQHPPASKANMIGVAANMVGAAARTADTSAAAPHHGPPRGALKSAGSCLAAAPAGISSDHHGSPRGAAAATRGNQAGSAIDKLTACTGPAAPTLGQASQSVAAATSSTLRSCTAGVAAPPPVSKSRAAAAAALSGATACESNVSAAAASINIGPQRMLPQASVSPGSLQSVDLSSAGRPSTPVQQPEAAAADRSSRHACTRSSSSLPQPSPCSVQQCASLELDSRQGSACSSSAEGEVRSASSSTRKVPSRLGRSFVSLGFLQPLQTGQQTGSMAAQQSATLELDSQHSSLLLEAERQVPACQPGSGGAEAERQLPSRTAATSMLARPFKSLGLQLRALIMPAVRSGGNAGAPLPLHAGTARIGEVPRGCVFADFQVDITDPIPEEEASNEMASYQDYW